MPKNNENVNGVKKSNPVNTLTHDTGKEPQKPRYRKVEITERELELEKAFNIIYKKYQVEKGAKNQAYNFILSCGKLQEFNAFCKSHTSEKLHEDCIRYLSEHTDKKGVNDTDQVFEIGKIDRAFEDAQDNKRTFLTDLNIRLLQNVFKDEETYIKHMETLWALRGIVLKQCEDTSSKELKWDKTNPLFRIAELANELIGALLQDITFSFDGEKVLHRKLGE